MSRKGIILISSAALLCLVLSLAAAYIFGVWLPDKQKREEQERVVREYYAEKLSKYAAENATFEDYEVDVAFLGDSLTDGCDLKKYYPYTTANRGIGGETTPGLESRLAVSVYELVPKVAVMLIGGNNLDTMLDNYEDIILGLRENLPNTEIVLVSLTAMGGDYARKNPTAAYNNVYIEKLAEKHGCYFADVFTPLFDIENGAIYSEYTTDGVHLNDAGYLVLSAALIPEIDKALDSFSAERSPR